MSLCKAWESKTNSAISNRTDRQVDGPFVMALLFYLSPLNGSSEILQFVDDVRCSVREQKADLSGVSAEEMLIKVEFTVTLLRSTVSLPGAHSLWRCI